VKKAIREWTFSLFTKRITIKVAKLPDNEKIEFLANKLMNELISQGHDINGSDECEFFTMFSTNGKIFINPNNCPQFQCKRLTKI